MIVRHATVADRAALVRMGLSFIAQSGYAAFVIPSEQQLLNLVDVLLALSVSGDALVLVAQAGLEPVGMLAGRAFVHPITGHTTATEIAWWIDPEHRGGRAAIRMLELFERWAFVEQRAQAVQMIAPKSTTLGGLYQRRGYLEVETTWQMTKVA